MNKEIQRYANSVARKHGHSIATEIILGSEDRVVSSTPYGFRKYTTGEYVPNAYRANFGWKNTYYQHAECVVEVDRKKLGV